MIKVFELCKDYGQNTGMVLDHLSFNLQAGETMSIIGPSGCGKTTLLYILAGLAEPSAGDVLIKDSRKIKPGEASSFILQDYGLFPWKTVYENLELALKIKKVSDAECKTIVPALLQELGLREHADKYPIQLSGGQKQRVAIGRALASKPELLLMDEPFSSLDAITRETLQNTILDMWKRRSLTYIIVTHSVEEAVFLGRRIMVLSDRPAGIKKLVDNPNFGCESFRMEECFFDKVREVRLVMGSNGSDAG